MKIGIDVDGVLANFNHGFMDLLAKVSGRDLMPARPCDPPCWDYPAYYGYTAAETEGAWEAALATGTFWQTLWPCPETRRVLEMLAERVRMYGDDVYFITNRPGAGAKEQTETWIKLYSPWLMPFNPTVLISDRKDMCADALDLDYYLDDKVENAIAVQAVGTTFSYLLNRPWNSEYKHLTEITRVDSPIDFLTKICPPVAAVHFESLSQ